MFARMMLKVHGIATQTQPKHLASSLVGSGEGEWIADCEEFLTPEPDGVGEGVYGIGRVLRRRRRRRRDDVCVWTL